jgi:hypothetical protein
MLNSRDGSYSRDANNGETPESEVMSTTVRTQQQQKCQQQHTDKKENNFFPHT